MLRGQRLTRPVTFLFNEGEEMGLLGARAFMDRDPLAGRIDTLINLEARGVSGPAIMFETSRPNAAAIALYQASSPRPVANSLTTGLYALIPNSTDVTVFHARPWTILNFAIIGNETRYHSAGDDLAALDRRSLQHMGEQTLAAARLVAAGEAPAAEGEWLYADLVGRFMRDDADMGRARAPRAVVALLRRDRLAATGAGTAVRRDDRRRDGRGGACLARPVGSRPDPRRRLSGAPGRWSRAPPLMPRRSPGRCWR